MTSILFTILFIYDPVFYPTPVSAQSFKIRLPFFNNYRVTAQFDHLYPNYNPFDTEVTIDNGDTSLTGNPYYYRSHNGVDFATPTNTPILAAASGIIYAVRDQVPQSGYGKYVYIDHQNGYFTLYAHLNSIGNFDGRQLAPGDPVESGYEIGKSGNSGTTLPHLHFGVYLGTNPFEEKYVTDPFGWTGRYPDPLIDYPLEGQGHQAECLWRSLPQDQISCNDIIFEDGGAGFGFYGSWDTYETGNGGHLTSTWSTPADDIAWWTLDDPGDIGRNRITPGTYKIFVYLPTNSDLTHYAIYYVYDGGVSVIVYLDQSVGQGQWVSLGTYRLTEDSFIVLHSNTGETGKFVVADGIKFRTYRTFNPAIYKQIPIQ